MAAVTSVGVMTTTYDAGLTKRATKTEMAARYNALIQIVTDAAMANGWAA
jgi:hypothetical protein